jgi:hypothetical protein
MRFRATRDVNLEHPYPSSLTKTPLSCGLQRAVLTVVSVGTARGRRHGIRERSERAGFQQFGEYRPRDRSDERLRPRGAAVVALGHDGLRLDYCRCLAPRADRKGFGVRQSSPLRRSAHEGYALRSQQTEQGQRLAVQRHHDRQYRERRGVISGQPRTQGWRHARIRLPDFQGGFRGESSDHRIPAALRP